jgi:hypothetical protein
LVLAPVSSAVLLRDDGMSYGEIARVLFLSDEGVRQQIEDYLRQNGKLQPENGGSEARLTDEQAKKLEAHLAACCTERGQAIGNVSLLS